MPKPFPNGKQAGICLSGMTTIDNATAKDWHIDVTSTSPLGATNQELMHRTALGEQPPQRRTTCATTPWSAPHRPRSASTPSTTNSTSQQARSSSRSRSRRRAATAPRRRRCATSSPSICATRVCPWGTWLKKEDVSFALRRGTIAQVTTLLALDRRATSPPSAPPRTSSPSTRWVWHGKTPLVRTRRAFTYCVGSYSTPSPSKAAQL
jgi:hypothetical protein